ncbi:Homoserine kinase [Candidatus Terasakiella magnetica]|uniref:Homoserine kinase n=1 Tax=Candidatus Terasakiella magnetica TaxID=1867952 RepID=A0A1C3RE99_9PROT|nr:homoserine kinase [Candidatus Terasakiella magnetica]SCA55585.1 Homoserine kinase [Candidatus Terasakiella magnetica]
MAVYTEVSDDELSTFVERFSIGALLSYKGIAEGVENSNYIIQTEQGPFILTLYEKRVNEADLPFFLNLLEHLSEREITCPVPLKDDKGQALGTLAGRPAAIFTFLSGMWPRKIKPVHCGELGRALAELHVAGRDFPMKRANDLGVMDWRGLLNQCLEHADDVQVGLGEKLSAELDYLEPRWPIGLPKGIIHADAFPDNVFFRGEKCSGLIDFYFACHDIFAYDLAICMNAWCFEKDGDFNVTKARLLLSNYRKVRDFSTEEVDALPMVARGAATRFLLTRLYDWVNTPKDALVKPKDPMEYFKILKFHQSVRSAAEYGLQ